MRTWGKYLLWIVCVHITPYSFATDPNPWSIVIDKSAYELRLYNKDKGGFYKLYPVTFGNKDLSDKEFEGDRKTPNGNFTIIFKSATRHSEWHRFMLLDYPTKTDALKFEKRKKDDPKKMKGKKIGGGIAIHGTLKGMEKNVDYYYQWTNGCISLKNKDVEELYNLVPEGTPVKIIPGTSPPLPPIKEPPIQANQGTKKSGS